MQLCGSVQEWLDIFCYWTDLKILWDISKLAPILSCSLLGSSMWETACEQQLVSGSGNAITP
jgi:hypothetical protein